MRIGTQKRAFVLLSTMFVILVLGLILRVAILRMPSALGIGSQSGSQQLAKTSAESGLEYAKAQLREDPTWKGGTSRLVVIDQPGLKVVSEQGNVIGTLTDPRGVTSEFRLRFNFQDGSDSTSGDKRPDPSSEFWCEFPYLSVNNLKEDAEAIVPGASGDRAVVLDPLAGPFNIPPHSVCLAVEGRTLRADGSVESRQVVQSVYLLDAERQVADAVLMAGGGIDVEVKDGKGKLQLGGSYLDLIEDQLLRLRTKKNVRVHHPGGDAAKVNIKGKSNVEIGYDESGNPLVGQFPTGRVATVNEHTGDGKDFYSLPWSEVKKAGSDAVRIPAGTYVYGDDPSAPSGRSITYYDMKYEQFLKNPDPGPGVRLSETLTEVRTDSLTVTNKQLSVKPTQIWIYDPASRVQYASKGFQWTTKDMDIKVVESANDVTSLAIVPRNPKKFRPTDSPTDYPDTGDPYVADDMSISLNSSTISVKDDVHLHGGVVGSGGTVTSEGSISILSGRTLSMKSEGKSEKEVRKEFEDLTAAGEVDDEEPEESGKKDQNSSLQLNLYAQKNLEVSTFSQELGVFRDLSFKGLLYCWGDADIVAGSHNSAKKSGNLTLRGALVAYGNDPQSGAPGEGQPDVIGGTGAVHIKAKNASLFWDPRYIPAVNELQPNGDSSFSLERIFVRYPN